MDDVLRRRLLGAAVLLLLAFVLASLLPDPQRAAPAGTGRAVTYDLRTGKPVEREPPRVEPEAGVPPPAPAPAQAPEPGSGPATAATSAPAPAEARRPSLKVDETLDEGAGGWFVQVGSFSSQSNARAVLQKLYGLGLPTMIQSIAVGKTIWYRVRVGPYDSEAPAQQALGRIRQQGYAQAKLVKPDAAPESRGN